MDKYKVLIVDDEPDNLALLYRTLRGKYDIAKSTSPLLALELLKTEHFHCILSDHKMPEMDGVEFLRQSCELQPDAMRLLVTAYTDAGILIDVIKSHVFHPLNVSFGIFTTPELIDQQSTNFFSNCFNSAWNI